MFWGETLHVHNPASAAQATLLPEVILEEGMTQEAGLVTACRTVKKRQLEGRPCKVTGFLFGLASFGRCLRGWQGLLSIILRQKALRRLRLKNDLKSTGLRALRSYGLVRPGVYRVQVYALRHCVVVCFLDLVFVCQIKRRLSIAVPATMDPIAQLVEVTHKRA